MLGILYSVDAEGIRRELSRLVDEPNEGKTDIWIQKAKALLFDCIYCVNSKNIIKDIGNKIKSAGGYDVMAGESSGTELKWRNNENA